MRRCILVVDGSASMNRADDFTPSRLSACLTPLRAFASAQLEADPVLRMAVVLASDGVARRICAPTSNPTEITAALEQHMKPGGGSGAFSVTNALDAALIELSDVLEQPAAPSSAMPFSSSSSSSTSRPHRPAFADLLLVCGSVTTVDAGDVFACIDAFSKRFQAVGLATPTVSCVSLDGAPFILQHLATATAGQLLCPLNPEHLARLLYGLVPQSGGTTREDDADVVEEGLVPRRVHRSEAAASPAAVDQPTVLQKYRRRHRRPSSSTNAATLNSLDMAVADRVGLVRHHDEAEDRCPLCFTPVAALPAPCRACGLTLLPEGAGLRAEAASKYMTWVSVQPASSRGGGEEDAAAAASSLTCHACCRKVEREGDLWRCELCSPSGRVPATVGVCGDCIRFVDDVLHACPLCGAPGR